MITFLNKGYTPIEVSILKWEDILNGVGHDDYENNCACCYTYKRCDCPIGQNASICKDKDNPYRQLHLHISEYHNKSNKSIDIKCPECLKLIKEEIHMLKCVEYMENEKHG